MRELYEKISSNVEEKLKPWGEGFMVFVGKKPELFCVLLLALLCLLFLFLGLDFYPLLDVDETRYAVMARDLANSLNCNSLYLNNVPFLEKPPLYFWLVAKSIHLFGGFSAFAVRFPIALIATFLTFFTYLTGRKVISRKFGMLSAIILLTSVFYLVLSHVAILDMVLTVMVTSAIYCGFLTHFCTEKKFSKYAWWYFWLFAGLAFLAKGILGLVIPVAVIFAYNLLTKSLKEFFKPINMLPGLLIFFAIIVPWHYVMYMEYGNKFITEYFILHHFARFIDSANIGRERPFLYFVPVFFVGFMPWSITFIAFIVDGFKKLGSQYKKAEGNFIKKINSLIKYETNEQKLVLFASVYFVLIFLMFSISSTKLPTYILPVLPAAALLTGYYWWRADEKKTMAEHEKSLEVSTLLLGGIFIGAGIIASVVISFLPSAIQAVLVDFKLAAIIGLTLVGMLMVMRLNTKRALSVFFSYVLVMVLVISICVANIFNIMYKGGQNEIVEYSNFAAKSPSQIVTFDFAVKPSVMVKSKGEVYFITNDNYKELEQTFSNEHVPTFVIVKNKHMKNSTYEEAINKDLELLKRGKRYSLYVNDINNEFAAAQKAESIKFIEMTPTP
jgi:4-amino-4-deoxy-L-arabinose transferase-like glycosyltransferase